MGRTTVEREYKEAEKQGVCLLDLTPTALAGYYMTKYPGDPIYALEVDIHQYNISSVRGYAARAILEALQGGNKCSGVTIV